MTKEFAREIADKFIKEHNPNLWDGLGNIQYYCCKGNL